MTRVIYHDYVTCVCLLYSTIKYFKWWAWIKTWTWSLIPQSACYISLSKIYLRLIFIISEVRVKALLWSALVRMKWIVIKHLSWYLTGLVNTTYLHGFSHFITDGNIVTVGSGSSYATAIVVSLNSLCWLDTVGF